MRMLKLDQPERTPERHADIGPTAMGRLRCRRMELLAIPTVLSRSVAPQALRDAIACTLPRVDAFMERPCGSHTLLCALCDAKRFEDQSAELELIEGRAPDPVGMRVVWARHEADQAARRATIRIETDDLGLRPIFHARTAAGELIVGTQPALLAALLGSTVSAESFSQASLIGYLLDDCTVFDDVRRLRPDQMIRIGGAGSGERIGERDQRTQEQSSSRSELIDRVVDRVAESFEQGDALELSGGMDSRLVLAMGLSRGVRPQLAFTIGDPADEDVRFAGQLCEHAGVEHVRLSASAGRDELASEGLRFVEQSAFTVDASAYAWLPSVFRRLGALRSGQIGGGGGECAGGFYDSPLDALAGASSGGLDLWIRRRLQNSGAGLTTCLDDDVAVSLEKTVLDRVRRWFDAHADEPWRDRTARFYREQRMPNAGGGVLSASACWYRPHQPLLSFPFQAWCDALEPKERRGRTAQRQLLKTLAPELAAIPLQGGRVVSTSGAAAAGRLGHIIAAQSEKFWRRALNRRKQPDLGAAKAANELAAQPIVEQLINDLLASNDLPLRRDNAGLALSGRTGWDERSIGMLITFALAHRRTNELRASLRPTGSTENSLGRHAA